jgi:uncharacterized protein YbbK (DUF523 family)
MNTPGPIYLVSAQNIREAFVKARSPSCAVSGRNGVTAALLRTAGLRLTEF